MRLKKIGRGILRVYLSFRLVVSVIAVLAVAGLGIWAKTALDTEIDESLLLRGDRTTRLYYHDSEL